MFIPVHIFYHLLPSSAGNPDCLMGKWKRGKVTLDAVKQSLAWALGGGEDVEEDIDMMMGLHARHPLWLQTKLEEMFSKCAATDFPPAIRASLGEDWEFKKEIVTMLQCEYGSYEELDYESLIVPLPDDWVQQQDRGDDEEGRPAKRLRASRGYLVRFK
jgi:hypothetical protein